MMSPSGSPLFPEQASTFAGRVDALYLFLVSLTAFFSLLIAGLIVYFAVKYRRRHPHQIGVSLHGAMALEIAWSVIPLIITLVIFGWSASVYYTIARTPDEALDIYVVGKQWMWKFQHVDGQAEINELHVPVNRAVRLTMTSQDVIHSLFVPAFRVKNDVIPGRYRVLWFEATKPGRYHLFCAEYCGTKHSGMIGQIVVMEPPDYQAWLTGGSAQGSLADAGQKLFQDLACNTCHKPDSTGRGPILQGLFGKTAQMQDGSTVTVDESYIRESILNPQAKITAGFQPIMPTFQGQVSEEGVLQLIEYIKSLTVQEQTPPVQAQTPAQAPRR
jgi:cytochrome c oxidase subunit II